MNHHLPDALAETLSLHLDLGKSRLETLAWLIIGVLVARTVNLSHLASQCDSAAQVDSSYRRLQRFFQFVTLEGDWLALAAVKLLKLKGPWVLCLDRTNWKIGRRDVNILMLAIATRRFRIPLMWQILEKGGSSNQGERIRLLERYLALFGVGSITWLLADREFIGDRWLKFLMKNKIFFAVRVKENSLVQFQNGRCHQLKSLLRRPFGFRLLHSQPARFQAMDSGLGFPLSFAAKRLGGGELLIVVSNGNGKRALKAYRRRWQIECLFGDSKTRGLNREDTRLTQPRKLDTLPVIITLAMAWAYACATAVKGTGTIKLCGHGYPCQILVPPRLRPAQKVDPKPAAKSRRGLEANLAKAQKHAEFQQSRVVWRTMYRARSGPISSSERICVTIAARREGASGRSRFDGASATAGVAET